MEVALVLLGVVLAHILAVVSPGPSLLVVARTAIASSRGAGAWTAVGLGIGSLIWALAALFGLQALFVAAPWLYLAMKLAGAAHLIYLAIMLWRHANDPLPLPSATGKSGGSHLAALRRGLFTQLANPKVAVFFGSVFVTLLPAQPAPIFYAVILPSVFLVECGWYVFVAYALSNVRLRNAYGRAKASIDRLTGGFLAALGIKLAVD